MNYLYTSPKPIGPHYSLLFCLSRNNSWNKYGRWHHPIGLAFPGLLNVRNQGLQLSLWSVKGKYMVNRVAWEGVLLVFLDTVSFSSLCSLFQIGIFEECGGRVLAAGQKNVDAGSTTDVPMEHTSKCTIHCEPHLCEPCYTRHFSFLSALRHVQASSWK